MAKLTFTTTTEVKVTVEQVAQLFAAMSDEQQADFFEHVGKIAETWDGSTQWWSIGRHMKTCACVSDVGRSVIDGIYGALHYKDEAA